MKVVSFLLLVSSSVFPTNGANILGIFTSYTYSHNIIHLAEVDALIEKGHNVTVITILPLKKKNPKLHHVFIPPSLETRTHLEEFKEHISNAKGLDNIMVLWNLVKARVRSQYEILFTDQFQNIIHGDTKFDLLILGCSLSTFQLAVAHQLKVPVVLSWVNSPIPPLNNLVGNPNSPVPFLLPRMHQSMGFLLRFKIVLYRAVWYIGEQLGHHKMVQCYE